MRHLVATKLSVVRLAIWSTMGYLSFKEFYIYASEGHHRKQSLVQPEYLWLPVIIAGLESLIVYKWYDQSFFKNPEGTTELWIKLVWAVGLTIYIGRIVYLKFFTDNSTRFIFVEDKERELEEKMA